MKKAGAWIDTIVGSVNRYVHLETSDGIQREGRMTGYRTKNVRLNGKPEEFITELELNGDPTDTIDISSLASIDID